MYVTYFIFFVMAVILITFCSLFEMFNQLKRLFSGWKTLFAFSTPALQFSSVAFFVPVLQFTCNWKIWFESFKLERIKLLPCSEHVIPIDFVSTSLRSKHLNGLLPTSNFPTFLFELDFLTTYKHLCLLFFYLNLGTWKVLLELSIYAIDLLGLYRPT